MVDDGWTLDDVKAFCDKYNIKLTVDYSPTTQYPEGTLLSQSRTPKTPIVENSTLKVTIAQEPTTTPTPSPSQTPEPSDNSSSTNE